MRTPLIIDLKDHPSNLDETARIVWENRATLDTVYRVRRGFVASIGGTGKAWADHYPTQEEAVAFLTNLRRTGWLKTEGRS